MSEWSFFAETYRRGRLSGGVLGRPERGAGGEWATSSNSFVTKFHAGKYSPKMWHDTHSIAVVSPVPAVFEVPVVLAVPAAQCLLLSAC